MKEQSPVTTAALSTLASTPGMGAVVAPTRTSTGSGDVFSPAQKKKKKKTSKRVKSYTEMFEWNISEMKQKLTETKETGITLDGKKVDLKSIEIDGIDRKDYPDFCDAYISAAKFEDGIVLDDDQLEKLQDENDNLVNGMIHDDQLWMGYED